MLEGKDKELELRKGLVVLYKKKQNSMVLYDKDNEEEKELSEHLASILFIEKLGDSCFISGSDDGVIKIWNFNGECVSTVDNNQGRILGYLVFEESFLYVLENEKIVSIDFQGKVIYEIDEQVESLDKIKSQGSTIHILSGNDLNIYKELSGEKIATFKNRDSFIDKFFLLSSGNILGKAGDEIFLYGTDGELICKFDKVFSLSKTIELGDEKFASLSGDENEVFVFDETGRLVSCSNNVELVGSLKKLINAFNELNELQTQKTKIEQFPHISSPLQKFAKDAKSILEKQKIDFNKSRYDKNIWDFFHRPLFGYLTRLLKKEENASKRFVREFLKQKEDLEREIEELNNNMRSLKASRGFFFNTALFVVIFAFSLPVFVEFTGLSEETIYIGVFGCFIAAIFLFKGASKKNKEVVDLDGRVKRLDSHIKTMGIIKNKHIDFIGELREYRKSILKQFPIASNPSLFDGAYVKSYIEELVNNKIAQIAMDECGIIKDDIIEQDKKPIILSEWSLIQRDTSRVDRDNIQSFWYSRNGLFFATQFLQYIFLTKDKIDVFSTHYDFIQNKAIGKEAKSFYYIDVTNTTKREVERKAPDEEMSIPAIEIILRASSGDSVELTILDDKHVIGSHGNEEENESIDFEARRREVEEDDSLSQEEKEDEFEMIKKWEEELKAMAYNPRNNKENISKADRAMQNIRTHINIHKQQ